MHSTISIDVAAPSELVFRLARDVERWPILLPHYASVRVEDRRDDGSVVARMVARRPLIPALGLGLPVAWRSRTWSEPATLRLRFLHRGGATDGMDVTWRIEPGPAGCRITIDHVFRRRLPIPLLGALLGDEILPAFVDRFFTRPIAGRTLATFRALAEAIAAETTAGAWSGERQT
jgi:ribosome-associated toxin RatA of RatAB toxin-antitoxin module